jgi:hypothetical protein
MLNHQSDVGTWHLHEYAEVKSLVCIHPVCADKRLSKGPIGLPL